MNANPIVQTVYGKLSGIQKENHEVYLGIPFAAPPTGKLRFCRPQKLEPWRGIRPATSFGPSAMQIRSLILGMSADGPISEDCLYLNVFTPKADGAKRPVMLWIHGGAFLYGSSNAAIYDGGPLAERGDVVVVTINYRIGAFGYLYLNGHGGRDWGAAPNCGQLDQIAALHWVKDNIAFFGGDPGNVTLFGESAGAASVCALLAMPEAKGLFHRAITQSGPPSFVMAADAASRFTDVMLAKLNIDPADTARLQELPAETILAAQPATWSSSFDKPAELRRSVAPVCDAETMPRPPIDVFASGEAKHIPFLAGTNRDEIKLFKLPTNGTPLSDRILFDMIQRMKPDFTAQKVQNLIGTYKLSRQRRGLSAENIDIFDAIAGDNTFRIPCIHAAEQHGAAYLYLFTWESPALRGYLKACHALEMPFVFGTIHKQSSTKFTGTGPAADKLSAIMMDAWIAFARTGNPNHGGMDTWPLYEPGCRATMIFGKETRCENDPFGAERAVWN